MLTSLTCLMSRASVHCTWLPRAGIHRLWRRCSNMEPTSTCRASSSKEARVPQLHCSDAAKPSLPLAEPGLPVGFWSILVSLVGTEWSWDTLCTLLLACLYTDQAEANGQGNSSCVKAEAATDHCGRPWCLMSDGTRSVSFHCGLDWRLMRVVHDKAYIRIAVLSQSKSPLLAWNTVSLVEA